ncbi:MAG: type II toxin-antitoxin system RelE/ParE family toxin [Planctomycetota bacterium]
MTSRPRRAGRRRSIIWSERARDDLCAIGDYIARDKPVVAEQWVSRLIAAVERAATMPFSGRVAPEFGRAEIREILLRRYRIVYRVRAEAIEVLTVFEGRRLLRDGVVDDEE